MTAHTFKVGDFAKSYYKARWRGVVIGVDKRAECSDLLRVLIVMDASGCRPRRRIVKTLDASWMRPTPPIDISKINPHWLVYKQENQNGST